MNYATEIVTFIQAYAADPTHERKNPQIEHDRLWYGVPVPVMRDFFKAWVQTHRASLTFDDWLNTLDALYHGESLEERTVTGILLNDFPKFRRELPFARLDAWLGQLEGWREIDSTCQSVFTAKEMLARWDEWQRFIHQLSTDANVNKRRASLVLLVLPVRESKDERVITLALKIADALVPERDKRITKAVSWVLREAVKNHRDAVAAFVETHETALPAATVREVQTKLRTGKKV